MDIPLRADHHVLMGRRSYVQLLSNFVGRFCIMMRNHAFEISRGHERKRQICQIPACYTYTDAISVDNEIFEKHRKLCTNSLIAL